jgi:tetratricopeptide (TPR) repeat protein
VRLARSLALFHVGLYAQAHREAEEAVAIAGRAPELLGEALARSAMLAHSLGDLASAAERYPQAIALTSTSYPWLCGVLGSAHARLLWDLGETERAVQTCRDAITAAVLNGRERPRADAERTLARMLLGLGQTAEALCRLERQLEEQVEQANVELQCGLARYIGLAHLDLGDPDEGEHWLRRARDLARMDGNSASVAYCDMGIAYAFGLRGQWAHANARLLRVNAQLEDAQIRPTGTFLGRCWLTVGAHKTGDQVLSEATLQASLDLYSANIPAPERAVLALACQVLGVVAPAPAPEGPRLLLARLAAAAWAVDDLA